MSVNAPAPGPVEHMKDGGGALQAVKKKWKPGPTDRLLWLVAYALTVVAVLLRTPVLHGTVHQRLQASEMAGLIKDEGMETLAVNVGLLLAVLVSTLLLGIFYSLAATVEKHVFTARRTVGGRSFGLFFTVALLCTLPVHAVSAALALSSPKDSGFYYLYVLVVGLTVPLWFRAGWKGRGQQKALTVFAFSLGVAGLSLLI
ncbi:hypothetical protein ME763_37220 (plasmid) [Streptomyces murinus]|uniref:hypothetical protein n=1 Tax=Streptomyces murinus TaxID=33900 RepID=UPI001180F686|nr:hypothetical protein [Streptomyces murinus]WDO11363.1 hypothetical protein ME763_37220 [Streptomyces murinus]